MALYELTPSGNILRTSDRVYIPMDPLNRDYVAYLAWVSGGNTVTPIPAVQLDQATQLAARIKFLAGKRTKAGDYLGGYAMLNGLPTPKR